MTHGSDTVEKRDYVRHHRPHGVSVAKGCRLMGLLRSTYYDPPPVKADDAEPSVSAVSIGRLSKSAPCLAERPHASCDARDVRFSNWPFGVKHLQTIHHHSVDGRSRARASLAVQCGGWTISRRANSRRTGSGGAGGRACSGGRGAFALSTCTCRSMFTSASTRPEGWPRRNPMRGKSHAVSRRRGARRRE
jgi:hypothetical protein